MTCKKTTQETAMMDCHAYPETAGKPDELAKAEKKKYISSPSSLILSILT